MNIILSNLPVSDGTRRRLEASLTRLSHAYIISGASLQVNGNLARQLAAAYVCTAQTERPCGVCPACRKAMNGGHPDIFYLKAEEDKQSITVKQIRAMRADAYIRPNEAARKVFVIEGTQLVGQNEAQNALLKVLEDGPDYTAFLFVVEQPEQLLTTIRSRCETLSLAARKQGADAELLEVARDAAHLLLDGGELELAEYMTLLEKKKWNRETVKEFLTALEDLLQDDLPGRTARTAALLALIREARMKVNRNVGIGHLLGWLAASRPVKE